MMPAQRGSNSLTRTPGTLVATAPNSPFSGVGPSGRHFLTAMTAAYASTKPAPTSHCA